MDAISEMFVGVMNPDDAFILGCELLGICALFLLGCFAEWTWRKWGPKQISDPVGEHMEKPNGL